MRLGYEGRLPEVPSLQSRHSRPVVGAVDRAAELRRMLRTQVSCCGRSEDRVRVECCRSWQGIVTDVGDDRVAAQTRVHIGTCAATQRKEGIIGTEYLRQGVVDNQEESSFAWRATRRASGARRRQQQGGDRCGMSKRAFHTLGIDRSGHETVANRDFAAAYLPTDR